MLWNANCIGSGKKPVIYKRFISRNAAAIFNILNLKLLNLIIDINYHTAQYIIRITAINRFNNPATLLQKKAKKKVIYFLRKPIAFKYKFI